jgi:hypothetical protein
MIMPDIEDLQNEIKSYKRRLQKLKERKALQGLSADPSLDIEIEDIEAKVNELSAQLRLLAVQTPTAPAAGHQTGLAGSSPAAQIDQSSQGNYNAISGAGPATVNIHHHYYGSANPAELPAQRIASDLEHILAVIYRETKHRPDQPLWLAGPDHLTSLGLDPDPRIHIQRCQALEREGYIANETSGANMAYSRLRLTEKGRRYCEFHKLS